MRLRVTAGLFVLVLSASVTRAQDKSASLAELQAAFREQSGIAIVFEERDLAPGKYHDVLIPLPTNRRVAALKIAIREARKLPTGFLQAVGLKTLGIFKACASQQGDGFRPFEKELNGYRYFGIYNGKDGVAAAYYTDEQLPLTFHHETFHHIDTLTAEAGREDLRLSQIIAGENLYPPPKINAKDLALLKQASQGRVLRETVSEYAQKNHAEDKAETARYLMSAMPDSLVQVVERPQLPGSQRLLHVLEKYHHALDGRGPTVDWFVSVALGRNDDSTAKIVQSDSQNSRQLIAGLWSFSSGNTQITEHAARKLLLDSENLAATLPTRDAAKLTMAAAAATQQLVTRCLAPSHDDQNFVVRGIEDSNGVNWTLREKVTNLGQDATRLAAIAAAATATSEIINSMQLQNLRLVSRFYVYINEHWRVTQQTKQVFEEARSKFLAAVAQNDPALSDQLNKLDLVAIAGAIDSQGALIGSENPYLKNVDAEIKDAALRIVIRGVQPACVKLGNGSGINLSAKGQILTASHVAERVRQRLPVVFPDGRKYMADCTAIDKDLDLAICSLSTNDRLPFARVANLPPRNGSLVVCIGQPGATSPEGEPTGYEPFNVSVGTIRGFLSDPLAPQHLGGTKHNAWTYWGHSGSPLFSDRGFIVAMHNSWDPKTAMRHAVTQQAIVKFLKDHDFDDFVALE